MTTPNLVSAVATSSLVAMAFTPTDPLTIIAAIGVLVASVSASVVNIIIALRTGAKVDVVAGHVNSAATASAGQIKALQDELRLMREVAADKKETAALLAQTTAQVVSATHVSPPKADVS